MGILDKLKKNKTENDEKIASLVSDTKKTTNKKSTQKSTKSVKDTISTGSTGKTGNAYKVLLRPLVSEKALTGEGTGIYTFEVGVKSTKVMVKQAISQVYGIIPKKVRIMNVDGKKVRFGKSSGRRKNWKKALVTLPKGKTISIHEGV